MDLWIRGQDRERLIKPIDFYIEANLNFHTAVPIDFDIYALNFANSDIKIGKYKTKERAIKVLDDIETHIRVAGKINTIDAVIYEMPEE